MNNVINKKEMLSLIEKHRKELNHLISSKESFEKIYLVSVTLDKLINSYMEKAV